ncbi:MAG TPA: adenosylcobinamide-GDP ribazoletransferase [Phenylobacterium sp.]|uniref:adenosylcobinamide-GDP ribazoletransferase n=1 Tax=Phenylobacterium sp. TaxID=1871053 RepID=UPI002B499DD5|nr:adenosylcobinamide-GDP ribazoletransferase [Phenylobacterium sp.]HKR86551.1 adenosylcobinamide-GDP ribazoletransferase [Phenylobacterium sp.]
MIGRELDRLACAAQFLTRLPIPGPKAWSDDLLARSAGYFPLVGLTVGGLCAAVLLLARLAWPTGVLPALLAVAVGVMVTGGFHEDGLADTADGLGGGHTREQRLAIMKDSRLGSYGALALGLVLAARIVALAHAGGPWRAAAVLFCAHGLGRAAAVVAMHLMPYAAEPAASKLKPVARDVRAHEAAIALLIAFAPLLLLNPVIAAAATLAGAAAALWPALAARGLISGYTGDVLGAIEQAFETAFLLGAAAVIGLGWT